jgi:alanyl-tRNA synthetase
LPAQQGLIEKVIQEEEAAFLRTLATGIQRFNDFLSKNNSKQAVPGDFAFELFDTFGFPIDLTQLMAREQGLEVDMESYAVHLKMQKDRSRAAASVEAGDWIELFDDDEQEFVGYDFLEAQVRIVRYREIQHKGKKQYQLVLNITPFYAESGGQVGDTGWLIGSNETIQITDTKKEHGQIVHFSDRLPADLNESFKAEVNSKLRLATMRNHSATHLLHAALRSVLGTHVEQKGSLVNDQYLRFDFSHFSKVSDEELQQIEQIVNARILDNIQRHVAVMPLDEARNLGAMALFGEKYADMVRVVSFDREYSVELCGGTHVPATGTIGLFRITSEAAVAAGIRRIEAITGEAALETVRHERELLSSINSMFNGAKDSLKALQQLMEEKQALEKKMEQIQREKAGEVHRSLEAAIETHANGKRLVAEIDLEVPDLVKNIAFDLKARHPELMLVLGHMNGEKPMITVALGDAALAGGLNAGNIVRELAREINGGGGGQAFYATAGGSNAAGMKAALEKARNF